MTLPKYAVLASNAVTSIDVTADTRAGQEVRVSVSSNGDCWVTGDGSTPTVAGDGVALITPGQWHETVAVTGSTSRVVRARTTAGGPGRVRVDRVHA